MSNSWDVVVGWLTCDDVVRWLLQRFMVDDRSCVGVDDGGGGGGGDNDGKDDDDQDDDGDDDGDNHYNDDDGNCCGLRYGNDGDDSLNMKMHQTNC